MGITIMINEKAWNYLKLKKQRNESFAEVLDRLLELNKLNINDIAKKEVQNSNKNGNDF